ncbi:MAG TPA: chemotaxis protein CheB [Kofleriaceae bacterium]
MARLPRKRHGATTRRSASKRDRARSTVAEPECPIVGVGASAGGIEALTELLSQLPADTGMAFVIIQHLAPAHPSLLAHVLLKATTMPVSEVVDGTRAASNHVYVIPPDRDLALRAGTLAVLARADERRPHMPIDRFFRSLAEDRKSAAIGVVLSGTAVDGTEGLKEIKRTGGITFAQDPATARYPNMPKSAIAAGVADHVLSTQDIAAELAGLAHDRPLQSASSGARDDAVVQQICGLLRMHTGIDFRSYKPSTIRRRIGRRMAMKQLERLGDYLALLNDNPTEIRALTEGMLIHVTSFFRDPEVFDALKTDVFPEILRHKGTDAPAIRIWVPGCSTGEEVYSIAIVLAEVLGEDLHRASIQIFGSDVSAAAIDKARNARYPDAIAQDVTEDRLRRFFTRTDHGYRIGKLLRELCVFVKHDVTRDPPFSRLDLVSCRNLLIYFSTELQQQVIPLLHYALIDPGFLLLGRTETIGGFGQRFTLEDRTNKIYRRKPGRARLTATFPAAVSFELQPAAGNKPRGATSAASGKASPRILREKRSPRGDKQLAQKLREELEATRGYLQSVIEDHSSTNDELASTNEALLSSNEELQSTNEELETAKEELQSANEELTTVNDELGGRNAELTQANNDLSNVMAGIEVPILLVGLDRRIRWFTPGAAETMNLIATDIGRPIRDINPHVTIQDLDRSIAEVIDTKQALEAEVRDDSGRWYRLQIRPYRTAEDKIEGAVVLLVDIDAPKRALEERERLLEQLRHERGFLEAVVQQMADGVLIAEAPSGKLILANHRMEELLGHELIPAASSSEYRADLGLHADGRPYEADEWPLARSIASGEIVISERIALQRADGGCTTVLTSAAPVRGADGRIFAGVVMFLDISREVEARARTDREQSLLAQTASLLGDVLDLDRTLQQTVRLVVPEFADWCIVDLQEPDGPIRQAAIAHADPEKEKLARDLSRHLPPDPELDHGIGHVMRTRKSEIYPLVTDEAWVASALSVEHPAVLRELGARSYICVPLIAHDRVVGALSLIRGESSQRYDEQSVRLADELGQRFAIAIDNARLHRTTAEAVRVRNEFFSIAAHELRTPIGTLLLHVQGMRLIAEQGQPVTMEAQLKSLAVIERQVQRLDQLVNTLLDVSRLAAGKFELLREPVDLAALTQEVVARFEAQARRAGAEIAVHAPHPVEGSWDRLRQEQVVANLVSNALKYGAGKPIEITVDADGQAARLVVQDHGIGIAAEDLRRIFNKFERAVPARHYAGLGMGLYITRQIVEAHGGTIRAVSEPGKGSIFTVELPRVPSANGSAEPESRPR